MCVSLAFNISAFCKTQRLRNKQMRMHRQNKPSAYLYNSSNIWARGKKEIKVSSLEVGMNVFCKQRHQQAEKH